MAASTSTYPRANYGDEYDEEDERWGDDDDGYSWFSLCAKQRQNVAQVLHNNRIEFPKDLFRYSFVHQHGRRRHSTTSREIWDYDDKDENEDDRDE